MSTKQPTDEAAVIAAIEIAHDTANICSHWPTDDATIGTTIRSTIITPHWTTFYPAEHATVISAEQSSKFSAFDPTVAQSHNTAIKPANSAPDYKLPNWPSFCCAVEVSHDYCSNEAWDDGCTIFHANIHAVVQSGGLSVQGRFSKLQLYWKGHED